MFKKNKCFNCKKEYDETFGECPDCHAPNLNLDPSFRHVTMLSYGKQIGLLLVEILGITLFPILLSAIFAAAGITDWNSSLLNMLLNTLVYVGMFAASLILLNKDLPKLLKCFKKLRPYIGGLICFMTIFITGILYSIILQLAGVEISSNGNQGAIDQTAMSFPFTSMIIFGLLGPICEELAFRVGLFSFFKRFSKWVAYPIGVLAFAIIHFSFGAANLTNELLNLPYYLLAGFVLCFTYDKYGFAGSVTGHILNNVISLIPGVVALGVFH